MKPDLRPPPPVWVIAAALSLLMGLQPLTTDLYLPAMPLIQQDLQAPLSGLQLTQSAMILSFGLAQLVWGPVADRWGRRPVLLLSLTLYAIASIGCAGAPAIGWLVGLRSAQGAMLAAAVVVGRATVRDLYDPAAGAQVMSRGMSGLGVIALLAVPLGGWLTEQFGWRATLMASGLMGGVALLFIAMRLPETLPVARRQGLHWRSLVQRCRHILSHRTFWSWAMLVTCTYAGLFILLSVSAIVYIRTLGLSPMDYGWALGSNSLAYLLGTFACRRWLPRMGLTATVQRGARFTALGAVALFLVGWAEAPSLWLLLPAQWLYAFGHGFHQPCGQTGAIGPFPQMAGMASALAGFIMSVVAFGIGLVLGWAFDGSVRFMAWGMALAGTATAAVALIWVRRHGGGAAPHAG